MSELLPCPFCGYSDDLVCELSDRDGMFIVECPSCGASSAYNNSEVECMDRWNRRSSPAATESGEKLKADMVRDFAEALDEIIAAASKGPSDLEKALYEVMRERDEAQEALAKSHIALGGDGKWVARTYPTEPGHSGNLCVDVPILAEEAAAGEGPTFDVRAAASDIADATNVNQDIIVGILDRHLTASKGPSAEAILRAIGFKDDDEGNLCRWLEKYRTRNGIDALIAAVRAEKREGPTREQWSAIRKGIAAHNDDRDAIGLAYEICDRYAPKEK